MKTKLWHVKQKLKTFYFSGLLTVVDCILCYNGDAVCLISTLSLAHKNLLIMICSLCSSGGGGLVSWSLTSLFSTNMAISETRVEVGTGYPGWSGTQPDCLCVCL